MMLLFVLIIIFGLALLSGIVKLPAEPRNNIGRGVGIIFILFGELLLIFLTVFLGIMIVINIVCRLLKLSAKMRKNTFIVIASMILVWLIEYVVYTSV